MENEELLMKDEVDLRMKGTACVAARSLSDPSRAVKCFHKSLFTVAAEGQGFYESPAAAIQHAKSE